MPTRRSVLGVLCLGLLGSAVEAATVPRQSPELAVQLANGKQWLLSQQRGKVVAVCFILTYCPHCQQTVQTLSRLKNEYGPKGFEVVSSAIEDMASLALPDFVRRFQPTFPVGFNSRDTVLEYLQHPAMFKLLMPQLVMVDRQGMIRGQWPGDDPFFGANQEKNLRVQIEGLLGAKKSATRKKSR